MAYQEDQTVKDAWVDSLADLLETITEANGYKTDVKKVYTEEPQIDKLAELPAIVVYVGADSTIRRPSGLHWKRCLVTLTVYLFSQENIQQAERDAEADIERLIYGDRYTTGIGFSLNGKCFECNITNVDPFGTLSERPNGGIDVLLQVDYHQKDADPTQLA